MAKDPSVTEAKGYNKKAEALQKLFAEQYGTTLSLSDGEKAAIESILRSDDSAEKYNWIPTYSKTGDIILIATNQKITADKSNYNASVIYYKGEYYYWYYNGLGSKYVGDKDFDISQLDKATTEKVNDTWVKME